ncbi:MAG: hypothetical protein CVV24_13725 [Ignavibacteriae bacterium HGW-Ignavibacteriae-3]|nr:MAG: hypothetical protein CVV24_13725 [Ignavibacteriae bacterium HGW-Ignavibacteriae-3]
MPASRVFILRNPQFGTCPECKKTGTLHRSRSRNMFEQIVRGTTFMKPYRCKECGWRGFRSTFIITRKSARNIVFYIMLIAITAFVARYILSRFVSV